jgi:hypothetical protein
MDEFDMVVGLTALERTFIDMGLKISHPGKAVEAAQAVLA